VKRRRWLNSEKRYCRGGEFPARRLNSFFLPQETTGLPAKHEEEEEEEHPDWMEAAANLLVALSGILFLFFVLDMLFSLPCAC
jgi:hypothetical protein